MVKIKWSGHPPILACQGRLPRMVEAKSKSNIESNGRNGASAEMAREVHPGLRELLLAMVNASRFLQRGSGLQAPLQSRSDGSSFEEMGPFLAGGQQMM